MNKIAKSVMTIFVVVMIFASHASVDAVGHGQTGNPMAAGAAVIPAFPGAEGFGANSIGGRGGSVYIVTNVKDSGAGSLRECVEASGARTCVFGIGGLIVLQSPLRISNPYITIAGQTAPGGGITLKTALGGDVFSTQTHDVIIRYITARPGPGGENHANQIAKNGTELYNIIIDHNSLSWGVDSNIETWYRVNNATIQWSIISEGLNNSTHSKGAHSKGIMIGGYQGSESGGKGSENVSVLNNLMAHNADRNPLMQLCGVAQVINNVTYNPLYTFSHQQLNCTTGESYVNWINNYHKRGPSSTSSTDLKIIPADSGTCGAGKAYIAGNYGSGTNGAWSQGFNGSCSGRTDIIVTVPAPAPVVLSTNALDAYNSVLAGAGNSRGIDCNGNWYNRRDAIDTRVINDVKNGTGSIIDDPSQVGGWISIAPGTPCIDSDHDGIPNVWEVKYGLNPNVSSDANQDLNGDGYTNIEDYINGIVPTTPNSTPIPTNTPAGTPIPTSTPAGTPTPTAVDQPSLVSPADGETLSTKRPTFIWDGISGATSYTLEISISSTFSTNAIRATVTGLSYNAANDLAAGKLYYWRVQAKNAAGMSAYSEARTFVAGNPPSVPLLRVPAKNALVASHSPVFDWVNSTIPAGAVFDHYELEIATDSGFVNKVHTDNLFGITNSQDATAVLSPATTYYWRVRSAGKYNSIDQYSIWSAVRSVRVAYLAPVLTGPTGAVGSLRPGFTWQAVAGAIAYRIQISAFPNFSKILTNAIVKGAAYTPASNLPTNKKLYWRVQVLGQYGPSAWSTALDFTTP